MNDVTVPAPLQQPQRGVFLPAPTSFEEAYRIAKVLAASDLVPKDYKGKPENCLVAMQWGADVGLPGLQALQNIAVINGRPSIWGDAAKALALNNPACDDIEEWTEGDGEKMVAVCVAKRKGKRPVEQRFSVDDAKKAGLWGKQGPWQNYPKRMLQMRARGFALRDAFPDALRGLVLAEEAQDFVEKEINPLPESAASRPARTVPALEFYPADQFDMNLPKWKELIARGKKTADQVIQIVEAKAPLTDEQKKTIRAAEQPQQADTVPAVTADTIADKLRAATNADQLDEIADLIGSVESAEERAALGDLYNERRIALEG